MCAASIDYSLGSSEIRNCCIRDLARHPGKSHRAEPGKLATHLRVVSDAAYKKETEDGYSLRGALFLRGEGIDQSAFSQNTTVHILDWACRSQRHVTRSTFSAELLAGGDAVDQGLLTSHMLLELESGPISMQEARNRRMQGGYIPTSLYLDAKSVYAAIIATFIKPPAEKSLLCHIQYIRELLDKGVIQYLFWIDTRDMISDGLTKGAVDRDALHALMDGVQKIQHAYEQWKSKQLIQLRDHFADDARARLPGNFSHSSAAGRRLPGYAQR